MTLKDMIEYAIVEVTAGVFVSAPDSLKMAEILTPILIEQIQKNWVWCVVEETNGKAVDCRVFFDQKEAHAYARSIKDKAIGDNVTYRDATVFRNNFESMKKSAPDRGGSDE